MSSVERNLLDGEVVVFRTRLHWHLFVWPVVLELLVMVPLGVLLYLNNYVAWAALPAALGSIPIFLAFIRRQSSEFAVTNKRVVIKLGVVTTRSLELLLSKVEGIAVNQGLAGKIFDYGDIIVTGSGGTKEAFSGIQSPAGLRRAIQSAADAHENLTKA